MFFTRRPLSARRYRRGFGLIDAMLSVGVATIMLVEFATIEADQNQTTAAITAGQQLAAVGASANAYLQKNNTALLGMVGQGSSVEVPIIGNPGWNGIGDLQYGGGLLGTNFSPMLSGGQTMHFMVRHVPVNGTIPDHLSGMILTSGPPMRDRQVGVAMNAMHGAGGGIMKSPPVGVPAGVIQGAFGNWQEPFSNWASSGVPMDVGQIAYTMDTIGSPISDYLNRYNTGNAEANRMHTSIDFNNNNAENMNQLDVANVIDSRNSSVLFSTMLNGDTNLETGVANAVRFLNGVRSCESNATGCGVQISDDGGFFDENDGWITLYNAGGNAGLNIANGSVRVAGYVNAGGYGRFGDRVGTNGYDPDSGYPSGWAGGVHTFDIYSEGSIGVGPGGSRYVTLNSGGLTISDDGSGNGNAAYINTAGNEQLSGRIGVNGYSPTSGYPSGWGGGVHTFDMYSEGSISTGVGGSVNTDINDGIVMAASMVQGNILRPTYVATNGSPCGTPSVPGSIDGAHSTAYATAVTAGNGDIAHDSTGQLLSCVNGTWSSPGFSKSWQTTINLNQGYVNNDGKAMFIATNCNDTPNGNGVLYYLTAYVSGPNGTSTVHSRVQEGGSDANFNASPFVSFIVPPGSSYSIYNSGSNGNMSCNEMIVE